MFSTGPLASYPLAGSGSGFVAQGDASDTFAALDPARADVWPTLVDTLAASTTARGDALANLIDRLVASASLSVGATLAGRASDGVTFTDRTIAAWNLLAQDSINSADTAVAHVRKVSAIIDALVATGQCSSTNQALAACVTALAMQALASQGFSATAVDSIALADTAASIAAVLAEALDSFVAGDSIAPILRVSVVGSETIGVGDDLSALLRANVDLADGLLVFASLRVGGDEWTGWLLNATTKAASTYTNTEFDSLCEFQGLHFGAGRNGLVQFGGTSDSGGPIPVAVGSFLMDLNIGTLKRCPDAWLAVTNTGDVVLKVKTREPLTGVACEDWYAPRRGPAINEGKAHVEIGRGLKSHFWGYELVNVDGSSLDLNGIELRPIALTRRT